MSMHLKKTDVTFSAGKISKLSFSSTSPGGMVLRISSEGDDRRIFMGLKFSILGFFWVGKLGEYLFVWLDLSGDLSRDVLGIQNDL